MAPLVVHRPRLLPPSLPPRWVAAFTVGLLLALAVSVSTARAQVVVIRRVVIEPAARAYLAADWRANANSLTANERGWCARPFLAVLQTVVDDADGRPVVVDDTVMHITEIVPPTFVMATTPISIQFKCPEHMVDGHTHGRNYCYADSTGTPDMHECELDGRFSNDCTPSPADVATDPRGTWDLELLQCDERAVIAYQGLPTANGPIKYVARHVGAVRADSTKGVEAVITAHLRNLDSVAASNALGPVIAPRVPMPPVDSTHVRHIPTPVYLTLLGLGTQLGRLDHDPGGYDRSRFYAGKFIQHSLAGFGLEASAERAHVAPWIALAGTCAAAVGYEYAQGYPNRRDMANGCGGALVSYLWGRVWRL